MTNHAARLFARAIDARLNADGAGSGMLPVFFALTEKAPRTQAELARIAAIEQPTMAATLARMERDGLIERRPDPSDKRKALIALTNDGAALIPRLRAATTQVNDAALARLAPQERAVFLDLLDRVCAGLEAHLRGEIASKEP